MANGLELILNLSLCLTCVPVNEPLPSNYIQNFDTGELVGGGMTLTTEMPSIGLDEDGNAITSGEDETLQAIKGKKKKLSNIKSWVNGRHLRIATLDDYPLSYTKEENGTVVGQGVAFILIEFLRTKFNFTYEIVKPELNIIGSKDDDFKGSLLEMLNSSKADLAAAFIPLLTDARERIFYSTTTLDEGEWVMVMQRPRESATGSGLLAPFDFWVWILIMVSLLAVGPTIYCLIILRNKLTGDDEQKPYSLSHCAWFVYGALMKQGSTLSPVADSTRLLFATWWIFITILTSFYTANLTAFLTLSKFTLPYNTVDDILYRSKQFVSLRGGGVEYSIRNTNESLSILNPMITKNYAVFSTETNDSVNLLTYVEKSGYVFIRDRPAISHALYTDYKYRKTISINDEKIHCPFAAAKEPFLKKMRSFAYPRNSNLTELFDSELLNLVESGIVKHLTGEKLPKAEICPLNLGSTERQLRNNDLLMTYYIMMAGFATAFAVFTTEILFRYLNGRRDRNNDSQWARHGIGRTPNGRLHFGTSHWLQRHQQHSGSSDKERLTSPTAINANVTPPPPYQSIFSSSNINKLTGSNDNFGNYGSINNNNKRWRRNVGNLGNGILLGHGMTTDSQNSSGVRRLINGRDYMVFRNPNGQSQLIPVRAPSAALFQYTYTE